MMLKTSVWVADKLHHFHKTVFKTKVKNMTTNRKVAVITGSYKGLALAIARKLDQQDDIWVIIGTHMKSV